jgi:hypothetical protein
MLNNLRFPVNSHRIPVATKIALFTGFVALTSEDSAVSRTLWCRQPAEVLTIDTPNHVPNDITVVFKTTRR